MATIAAGGWSMRWRRFAQPAHLLYAILLIETLVSVSLALAFGFRAASLTSFAPQLFCVLLVISGPLARRIDFTRLAGSCETVGFLYGQGFALAPLLYPMTAIAASFADPQLAAADRMLGFDWLAFANAVRDHEWVLRVMKAAYFSFAWQAVILLPALFMTGRSRRAWVVILSANVALLTTLLIYPSMPAVGPFAYYGITPASYPNMSAQVAWVSGPTIHAIRDHGARIITKELMVAFVSIPSYHAAAAVLFAWAAWPIRWLRWGTIILNVAMTISALIIGGHYLIDLVGGALIGGLSIPVARAVLRRVACEPEALGVSERTTLFWRFGR